MIFRILGLALLSRMGQKLEGSSRPSRARHGNYRQVVLYSGPFIPPVTMRRLACVVVQGISLCEAGGRNNKFTKQVSTWTTVFCVLTLATNVIGTSLITLRIW